MPDTDVVETTALSGPVRTFVDTGVTTEDAAMRDKPASINNSEGWGRIIDDLLDWKSSGFEEFEAEGLRAPNSEVISAAIDLANRIRGKGTVAPPSRVVPNGNGGLVLERWTGQADFERIEIFEDLTANLSAYKDSKRTFSQALVIR